MALAASFLYNPSCLCDCVTATENESVKPSLALLAPSLSFMVCLASSWVLLLSVDDVVFCGKAQILGLKNARQGLYHLDKCHGFTAPGSAELEGQGLRGDYEQGLCFTLEIGKGCRAVFSLHFDLMLEMSKTRKLVYHSLFCGCHKTL